MIEPRSPESEPSEPAAPAAAAATSEDQVSLDSLEADLAAVDRAIQTLDSITASESSGSAAADQITVAVPPERFGRPGVA